MNARHAESICPGTWMSRSAVHGSVRGPRRNRPDEIVLTMSSEMLKLPGFAKAMRRQIEKARAGKLTPDDLSGGTYSISNNGAFGTTFTTPIINAPQVAILSTDAIKPKPGIVSTPQGDFVAARMMGMVGQSFDHRAFDGAYSAAFLSNLKRILEERSWDDEIAGNS